MAVGASRIYHVNSNCTDLDRSLEFYEALGLRRVLRTRPGAPQPGAAFGLVEVAWDAWMVSSDDGLDGILLDLLQWTTPGPTGAPPTANQPGLNRICVTTPHLDDVLVAVGDVGGRLVGGPVEADAGGGRTATVQDPDGVAVQVIDGDRTSIAQVVVNSTDLVRSVEYYRDVMGLRPVGEVRTVDQPAELHGSSVSGTARTLSLADGGSTVRVTLAEWREPPARATAAPRAANELGLFRMAWSTDDCRRDEGVLRAAGSEPFAATSELSVGDDLPLLRVLFWPGPDGECLELIEVAGDGGATP